MSCSCRFGYEGCYDGPSIDLWREGRVLRTRKEHRCCECSETIPRGSRACYVTSLQEGSWWTSYRCVSCSIYSEMISEMAELCPLWGHLGDFVTDNDLHLDGLPTLREWQSQTREAI